MTGSGRETPDWSAFKHAFVKLNDLTCHLVSLEGGPQDQRPLLFLHGFPDIWSVWGSTMWVLRGKRTCYAPDLRGYHLTDAPRGADAYRSDHLLADLIALIGQIDQGDGVDVVGHDWGGVLAAWLAATKPTSIAKLILVNAVHPVAFQRALWHDPNQRAASAYLARLKAADGLSAPALTKLSDQARIWLDDNIQSGALGPYEASLYQSAYASDDRWRAMASWYHASPFEVNEGPVGADWTRGQSWQVQTPTLLAWGNQDPVFVRQTFEAQRAYFTNHSTAIFTDHGHNLPRHAPIDLAGAIETFLEEPL
jgi:epoxide hydrolase 4